MRPRAPVRHRAPGYVALLPPRGRVARGDSAAMVAARAAFLGAGHFAPIADALVGAARAATGSGAGAGLVVDGGAGAGAGGGRLIVDVGAGPGSHPAALLDALPGRGASRSTPRGPRCAAPLARIRGSPRSRATPGRSCRSRGDGGAVVNVFAPRNGSEIARVLGPGGALVVVTPTERHLAQLVEPLGLLGVDADKAARLHATLSPDLRPVSRRQVEFDMALDHDDVRALVAMGPSAHHVGAEELGGRLASLPAKVRVTAAVNVDTFAPAG